MYFLQCSMLDSYHIILYVNKRLVKRICAFVLFGQLLKHFQLFPTHLFLLGL